MDKYIPLSIPTINGNEWKYVKECLDTNWVSTAGEYVKKFEKDITNFTNSKFAIACSNGTSALQVCLRLAGVLPQDEVIIPTLTFIAPVNAINYNNAIPVFMDCDDYFNIDIEKTIEFITKETKIIDGFSYNIKTNNRISAIIPVHIWGNAVLLDQLEEICLDRNIKIIEDSSESLGTFYRNGKYNKKHTGTIGVMGCISFNGNKIITTGGGGAIITDDETIAEKAKYLTTQAKDDPINYVHNEVGYNFRLTNIQAALGVAQLEQLPKFLLQKKSIFNNYNKYVDISKGIHINSVPNYANNNHWINILRFHSPTYGLELNEIINKLENNRIQTRPVWRLNHLQKPYSKCQAFKIDKATKLVSESLCLPSSSSMTEDQISYIAKHLNQNE